MGLLNDLSVLPLKTTKPLKAWTQLFFIQVIQCMYIYTYLYNVGVKYEQQLFFHFLPQ